MSSKMFNIDASDQSSSIFQPSHKNEMLAFHISASTMQVDIFKMAGHFPAVLEGYFWQNLGTFSSHANGNKTLYFWQHMRTFSSGVSGNKTRYFWRKLGWFLSVFVATTWWDEMFGHFQAMLMTTKLHIFDRTLGPFQAMPGATTQEMFDEERDNFQLYFWRQNQVCQNTIFLLNLTSEFLCLNCARL